MFVQTDDPAGNHVVAYDRAADGTLTLAGTLRDRRSGRRARRLGRRPSRLAGFARLRQPARAAVAVNAGSDTVSVFSVDGDRLRLQQVVALRRRRSRSASPCTATPSTC